MVLIYPDPRTEFPVKIMANSTGWRQKVIRVQGIEPRATAIKRDGGNGSHLHRHLNTTTLPTHIYQWLVQSHCSSHLSESKPEMQYFILQICKMNVGLKTGHYNLSTGRRWGTWGRLKPFWIGLHLMCMFLDPHSCLNYTKCRLYYRCDLIFKLACVI